MYKLIGFIASCIYLIMVVINYGYQDHFDDSIFHILVCLTIIILLIRKKTNWRYIQILSFYILVEQFLLTIVWYNQTKDPFYTIFLVYIYIALFFLVFSLINTFRTKQKLNLREKNIVSFIVHPLYLFWNSVVF
jgi:hypothetical protein